MEWVKPLCKFLDPLGFRPTNSPTTFLVSALEHFVEALKAASNTDVTLRIWKASRLNSSGLQII